MFRVCHCMCISSGAGSPWAGSPCRKISLLGVVHPVVGKYISGTRGVPEVETGPRTQLSKRSGCGQFHIL